MDAVKFIKERNRMCKSYYDVEKGYCADGCPAHDIQCIELDDLNTQAEELVARVKEWSSTHPRKTRQSVFLEHYPDAWTYADGVLSICPNKIADWHRGAIGECIDEAKMCDNCRHEFWMQEVE